MSVLKYSRVRIANPLLESHPVSLGFRKYELANGVRYIGDYTSTTNVHYSIYITIFNGNVAGSIRSNSANISNTCKLSPMTDTTIDDLVLSCISSLISSVDNNVSFVVYDEPMTVFDLTEPLF